MKKILIIIAIVIFLSSCNYKNDNIQNCSSQNNKNIVTSEFDFNKYSYLMFPSVLQGMYSRTISLSFVKEHLNNLYIRKKDNYLYTMSKIKINHTSGFLFLLFDNSSADSYILIDGMFVNEIHYKSDYKTIKCNHSTVKDVLKLDSATITHDIGGEITSFHRTIDNSIILISYKQKNNECYVKNIKYYNDALQFFNILSCSDLKLLQS